MKTYALICDLKDDAEAIDAYVECHKAVDPEILASLHTAGIVEMKIYQWRNRLTMTLVGDENFTFGKKAELDQANPRVQEWEAFLGKFQVNLPGTPDTWRWQVMNPIFEYKNNT